MFLEWATTSEIRTVNAATDAVHMMKRGEDLTLKPIGLPPIAYVDRASTGLSFRQAQRGIKKAGHPHKSAPCCT